MCHPLRFTNQSRMTRCKLELPEVPFPACDCTMPGPLSRWTLKRVSFFVVVTNAVVYCLFMTSAVQETQVTFQSASGGGEWWVMTVMIGVGFFISQCKRTLCAWSGVSRQTRTHWYIHPLSECLAGITRSGSFLFVGALQNLFFLYIYIYDAKQKFKENNKLA